MFLEKFSRFFRQYDLTFQPRHKDAARLLLVAKDGLPSIEDALQIRINADEAHDVQSNGDIVELLEVSPSANPPTLTLLFHRASPDAADPAYRKKIQAAGAKTGPAKFSIRTSVKQRGEEQSVSAHLVIRELEAAKGRYRAVLEEIPGISMAVVRQIIAKALFDYSYPFMRRGKQETTYSTVKAEGLKSETMENALKNGDINFVTLVRHAKPDFVDASGLFEPSTETMKLRVRKSITSEDFKFAIGKLFSKAKERGWEQFNVDVEFDDKRRRTVRIEKEQDAKELLFVRSEQVPFSKALSVCAITINDDIKNAAIAVAKKK